MENLPQILAAAIDNEPDLCIKVRLICIDGSKFIDADNPALDIYDSMLNQGCPERQKGEPETMQALKFYWNSLRRKSDKSLVLVFYESTPPNPPLVRGGTTAPHSPLVRGGTTAPNSPLVRGGAREGVGFSEVFLKALSKFDGAICVVSEQPEIPLQTFLPSQADLVEAMLGWISAIALPN